MNLRIPAKGKPAEGVLAVLSRLAREICVDAEDLRTDPEERVHSIRIGIKKYRALLRLAEPEIDGGNLRALKQSMAALKGGLATSRDQLVVVGTASEILGPDATGVVPLPDVEESGDNAKLVALATDLADRTARLDLTGVKRRTLEARWKRTVRRSRRARKKAERSWNAAEFHRWRKRTKDLWYQAVALCDIRKDARPLVAPAKALSAILGNEHDVTVTLESLPGLSRHDRRKLKKRREKLRRQALAAGAGI